MNILAFAASNSKQSINKSLVDYVLEFFSTDTIEKLDLNDFEMPIYSIDKEKENGIPEKAYSFAKMIDKSDFIIISFAEHNGSYSVAFKNIFDWISRIKDRATLGNKPILVMATSTGKRGGKSVLEAAVNRFPFSGGHIVGSFSLPNFLDNFHSKIGILDQNKKLELEQIIVEAKEKSTTPKLK